VKYSASLRCTRFQVFSSVTAPPIFLSENDDTELDDSGLPVLVIDRPFGCGEIPIKREMDSKTSPAKTT